MVNCTIVIRMPHTFMASQAVCEKLHIDRSTLSRWVSSGKIAPAMRLPGRTGAFLFDPEDVARLETAGAPS